MWVHWATSLCYITCMFNCYIRFEESIYSRCNTNELQQSSEITHILVCDTRVCLLRITSNLLRKKGEKNNFLGSPKRWVGCDVNYEQNCNCDCHRWLTPKILYQSVAAWQFEKSLFSKLYFFFFQFCNIITLQLQAP